MYHVFYPWLMKLEGSRQLLRFPADDLVLALHSIKTSPVGGRLDVGRNKILPVVVVEYQVQSFLSHVTRFQIYTGGSGNAPLPGNNHYVEST